MFNFEFYIVNLVSYFFYFNFIFLLIWFYILTFVSLITHIIKKRWQIKKWKIEVYDNKIKKRFNFVIVDSTQVCSDCEEKIHNVKKCYFREISLNILLMFYWGLKINRAFLGYEINVRILNFKRIRKSIRAWRWIRYFARGEHGITWPYTSFWVQGNIDKRTLKAG